MKHARLYFEQLSRRTFQSVRRDEESEVVGGGGGGGDFRANAALQTLASVSLKSWKELFSHATWNTNKYALFNGVSQSFWVYEYLRETVERESVNSEQHRR